MSENQLPENILNTYVLQLIGEPGPYSTPGGITATVCGIVPSLLREVEENLSDLLPSGYSVRIKEWDSDE